MQIIQEEISRFNEADENADLDDLKAQKEYDELTDLTDLNAAYADLNALAKAAAKAAAKNPKDPKYLENLENAMRPFHERLGPFLVRLQEKNKPFALFKTNGDKAAAEDALQDMAEKVTKNFSTFRGDSKFTTWAAAIAKNAIIDKFRKKKREVSYGSSVDLAKAERGFSEPTTKVPSGSRTISMSPEEKLLRKELKKERSGGFELLMQAIENNEIKLNDNEKAVMLNQLSDNPLSVKELAKKLNLSSEKRTGTISSQYREKIKKWLAKNPRINSIFSGGVAAGDIEGDIEEAALPTNEIQKEELSLEKIIAEVLSELV